MSRFIYISLHKLSQPIYTPYSPSPCHFSPGQKWPQIGSVKNRKPVRANNIVSLVVERANISYFGGRSGGGVRIFGSFP
jgi:hypothetical protein